VTTNLKTKQLLTVVVASPAIAVLLCPELLEDTTLIPSSLDTDQEMDVDPWDIELVHVYVDGSLPVAVLYHKECVA
jgi:hypothetical protein